jgi:hypothetical protein
LDTIEVRRPTGIGTDKIGIRELQCWVNGVNVIANNVIISYFVSLLIEYVDTGGDTIEITDNFIDAADSISSTNGTSDSLNVNTALIIKFSLALINDLQSIVYNRRIFTQNSFGLFSDAAKALGLAVELYNSLRILPWMKY